MLEKLKKIWEKWGFEIVLGLSVFVIIVYALCRIGKKGRWSQSYSYTPGMLSGKGNKNKRANNNRGDSRGELECRRVLENIFKTPFSKSRPDFLRNPVTGNVHNCELDCYNAELKLAVEYNGQQHYRYVPHFHRNKDAFYNQKYRDQWKRRVCEDNGITLIEVPYTVKIPDIRDYLLKNLRQLGLIK